jgi:hypothetical protein
MIGLNASVPLVIHFDAIGDFEQYVINSPTKNDETIIVTELPEENEIPVYAYTIVGGSVVATVTAKGEDFYDDFIKTLKTNDIPYFFGTVEIPGSDSLPKRRK